MPRRPSAARDGPRCPLLYSRAAFVHNSEESDVSSPRHPVVVSAAITGNGKGLLAVYRRDTNRWEAPGGYLERDETIDEAVRRTVWEGTGLLVRPVILTGVYKDMARGEVALVFRCTLIGNDVDRRVDAAAGRWLTAAEVSSLMDDVSAERLLDAVRLGPPKIRSYVGPLSQGLSRPVTQNPSPDQGIAIGAEGVHHSEQPGDQAVLDG